MNLHRWNRREKLLLLISATCLGGWTGRVALAEREYRGDVVRQNLAALNVSWNPFASRESNCYRRYCRANLHMAWLALAQYSDDYGGRYPIVKSGGAYYGWADAINLYGFSAWHRHCPQSGGSIQATIGPRNTAYTEYYLDSRLAGAERGVGTQLEREILLGEGGGIGEPGDARYARADLPSGWLANKQSPVFRHLEPHVFARRGSYYLLADGHVQFVTPRELKDRIVFFPNK